ncbi:MAG: DNA topoisomerase 3 [Lachnospiraceae bacterium]
MELVIAEKPSVAQSIAAVIGADGRKDGYLEGNGYRVSWCIGHLIGLANAEAYDARYVKWKYDDLPIIPEKWQYFVDPDKKKQFDILKRLMNASDISAVINACDAGREGEAIFRGVYQLSGCRKPMKRLWISSMEDEAIRKGFANLHPGSDYDGLHHAAQCRNKADWLVGINATRLFSVLYRKKLNIGRVMSPTLAMVVKREAEIDAFRPEPFYTVVLDMGDYSVASAKMKEKEETQKLMERCSGAAAIIQKTEKKMKVEKPPALYDLTTLQREANRMLGYTAQQTLDYLQSLYEKKLCTYPRTDSRYLTSDMVEGLPELVKITADTMPFASGLPIVPKMAQVINDKKVTDHHAIIPTKNIGEKQPEDLPLGERSILELISLRLLCAVSDPYEYAETIVTMECAGQTFTAKGKETKAPGWKILDARYRVSLKNSEKAEKERDNQSIPDITEGTSIPVTSAAMHEGKTSPPGRFTEDSLLAAMESAGEKDMPEDAERKGLGTPATRAAILEKLVSAGFLDRKKTKKTTHLIPTNTAVSLITVLPEELQSPLLTAEWEYQLKEVERGEREPEIFLQGITKMLQELVKNYTAVKGAEVLFSSDKEVIGKCPRCGGNVTESRKGFFCENRDCRFVLWKNNRFFEAKKKQVTKEIAAKLLSEGKVKLTGCYSEKTGKTYDAVVILEDDGQNVNFMMEFDNRKGGKQ